MAIRLSLPTYNPSKPLHVRAECSVSFHGIYGAPMYFRVQPDEFVGRVLIPFHEKMIPPFAVGPDRVFFTAELDIEDPRTYGMNGGEGWFALTGSHPYFVFVHDVQVYYTPNDQDGLGRQEGFYS